MDSVYPTTEITSVHAAASLWLAAASPWSVDGIATASPWSVDGIPTCSGAVGWAKLLATVALPRTKLSYPPTWSCTAWPPVAGRPTGNLTSHFAEPLAAVIDAVVLDDDAFRGAG